jgi:glycosyltransferase involved in cell wall biosynthesis
VPRKILLLITDLEIGGTPTVVRELATRLHDPGRGVEIEVACLKPRGPVADQIEAAGVRVASFDATRVWQLPAMVRRLRALITERGIDTVFSFLVHANTVAAIASRELPGVRFIQSIQTVQYRPRWHWWVQKRIHDRADQVVGPSSGVAQVARDWCGVPPEKVVVIPNAVDPNAFPRLQVFTDPARIRVGFLGRLDPVKNLSFWLQSVWFADRDDVRVEGHIFGDGAGRAAAEKDIAALKVQHRVFLRGATKSPQEALSQMDLLYSASVGEGFGLVIIEAMASGVPVIAVKAGGVSDIIEDGANGLLIPDEMFSYRTFSVLMDKLHDDVVLRQRIIENGLRTVREKFTWDVILPQYRALLGI